MERDTVGPTTSDDPMVVTKRFRALSNYLVKLLDLLDAVPLERGESLEQWAVRLPDEQLRTWLKVCADYDKEKAEASAVIEGWR